MKKKLKKIVLSSSFLTNIALYFRRKYLKRKHGVKFGKKVFIGFSTICEGQNSFSSNSSIVSSFIGYASYLAEGTRFSRTKIGRYCSIGPNVSCIFGKHPSKTFVSTHPAFFSLKNPVDLYYSKTQRFKEFADFRIEKGKYSIIIGNDVWIGANVSIMDGVKIGDGVIIAANALIIKDVPPYTIIGGIPAKKIKMRFSQEEIEFLLKLKWWDKSKTWIEDHAEYFDDIKKLQNQLLNG